MLSPGRPGFAAVSLPSRFEPVDQALLDGWADMAVNTTYAGQSVTQPFGLGDLGHAVLDQPRLVAMPQIMEMQSADDGGNSVDRIAVRSGAPVPAVETGSTMQAAVAAGEDVVVIVAVEVGTEQCDKERWQQDVAGGGRGLGWPERQVPADLVEVALIGVDEDAVVVEFAVAAAQTLYDANTRCMALTCARMAGSGGS